MVKQYSEDLLPALAGQKKRGLFTELESGIRETLKEARL